MSVYFEKTSMEFQDSQVFKIINILILIADNSNVRGTLQVIRSIIYYLRVIQFAFFHSRVGKHFFRLQREKLHHQYNIIHLQVQDLVTCKQRWAL